MTESKFIPLERKKSKGRPPVYPWDTAKVGESFRINMTLRSARTAISRVKSAKNKEFQLGTVDGVLHARRVS